MTLRALAGAPLGDETVRRMVVAAARATAERHGVELVSAQADHSSIELAVAAAPIVALGLAAELRRLTNEWFAHTHGGRALWGAARIEGCDEERDAGDWWKEA